MHSLQFTKKHLVRLSRNSTIENIALKVKRWKRNSLYYSLSFGPFLKLAQLPLAVAMP